MFNCDMATWMIVEMRDALWWVVLSGEACVYAWRKWSRISVLSLLSTIIGCLVVCQTCGPLRLHATVIIEERESKKCFEAQDRWLFFWGAYGTRSMCLYSHSRFLLTLSWSLTQVDIRKIPPGWSSTRGDKTCHLKGGGIRPCPRDCYLSNSQCVRGGRVPT